MIKQDKASSYKSTGFGTHMSITAYLYILLTMVFTLVIFLTVLRSSFEKSKFKFIKDAGISKKLEIENAFNYQLEQLQFFVDKDETKSMTENLIISFRKYSTENPTYFDPSVSEDFKNILKEYYSFEILDKIPNGPTSAEYLVPNDKLSVAFQFIFMVENPNPLNEKNKLKDINDGTSYGRFHSAYHNKFLKFMQSMNFKDLYLIDIKTGRVVYNVNKNLASGTDLYEGNFRQSGLAMAFKEVASSPEDIFYVEDFSDFVPSYNNSSAFIGIPVTRYGTKTGVLIAEVDLSYFNDFYEGDDSKNSQTHITYDLIGKDLSLRMTQKQEDIDKNKEAESPSNTDIELNKTQGHFNSYPAEIETFLSDKGQTLESKDYKGETNLMFITPIDLANLKLYQISKSQKHLSFSEIRNVLLILLSGYLLFGLALIITIRHLRINFFRRLTKLKESMKELIRGNISEDIIDNSNDPISETVHLYNSIKDRISEITGFSLKLSKGNYQSEFTSNSENDVLASSLTTLKETLIQNRANQEKREEEDEIRKWINEGVVSFNDYLRQNNHDIKLLSELIIEKLIHYIDANQGGIFIINEDEVVQEQEDKILHLIASYAYDRKKFVQKTIYAGEGLIGNCFLEQKPVYLKDIPEDYLDIRSGLGSTKPKSLYIIPLIVDDEVMGIIELASMYELEEKHFEFLHKVVDNIAATFKTVRLNTKTTELLEISKKRANEISQQEEEMRQNMEEMLATQEELSRVRDEDEKRTNDLRKQVDNTNLVFNNLINSVEGELYIKDENGEIVYANQAFANRISQHIDDIIGKPFENFIAEEHKQKERETDEEAKLEGSISWNEVETRKSKDITFHLTKRRFYIDTIQSNGIMFTRYSFGTEK